MLKGYAHEMHPIARQIGQQLEADFIKGLDNGMDIVDVMCILTQGLSFLFYVTCHDDKDAQIGITMDIMNNAIGYMKATEKDVAEIKKGKR